MVVGRQVVAFVVDQDDARRGVVVDVDHVRVDLVPAQLFGGRHGVVPREYFHWAARLGAAVNDNRPVLAEPVERFDDGRHVAAARVFVVRRQVGDGDHWHGSFGSKVKFRPGVYKGGHRSVHA